MQKGNCLLGNESKPNVISIPLPPGWVLKYPDRRAVSQGDYYVNGLATHVSIEKWVTNKPSQYPSFIVEKIKQPIIPRATSITTQEIYDEDTLIPEGFEQGPFTMYTLKGYDYYLAPSGQACIRGEGKFLSPKILLKKVS